MHNIDHTPSFVHTKQTEHRTRNGQRGQSKRNGTDRQSSCNIGRRRLRLLITASVCECGAVYVCEITNAAQLSREWLKKYMIFRRSFGNVRCGLQVMFGRRPAERLQVLADRTRCIFRWRSKTRRGKINAWRTRRNCPRWSHGGNRARYGQTRQCDNRKTRVIRIVDFHRTLVIYRNDNSYWKL